ncbi:hypothetical protein IWX90DRAFT_238298 [Phyllosticta citrichinensis]|uniref:Uncharacterized protein n=1 Tax=Phyllosticta citrichinensis TaxID=1130410 RepID=A0ABR1XPW5_9PEZI
MPGPIFFFICVGRGIRAHRLFMVGPLPPFHPQQHVPAVTINARARPDRSTGVREASSAERAPPSLLDGRKQLHCLPPGVPESWRAAGLPWHPKTMHSAVACLPPLNHDERVATCFSNYQPRRPATLNQPLRNSILLAIVVASNTPRWCMTD